MSSPLGSWLTMAFDTVAFTIDSQRQGAIDRENVQRLQLAAAQQRRARVDALERGGQAAGQLRARGTNMQGQQRIANAMGSLDSGSGTAAQLAASTGWYAELDAQTALNNARAQALGHEQAAQRYADNITEIRRAAEARNAEFGGRFAKNALSFLGSAAGGM